MGMKSSHQQNVYAIVRWFVSCKFLSSFNVWWQTSMFSKADTI
jgi:hypothetical protein